jgi:hypothetical protein
MKRICCFVLSVLLILSITIPASANDSSSETEFFFDGSYIVTTLSVPNSRSSSKYTKTTTYYNSDNEKMWSYSVTATFNYDGSKVSCSSVTDSYAIANSAWTCSSHSTSSSEGTASGTITMKQRVLGITIQTITRTVSITCDKNGNVS